MKNKIRSRILLFFVLAILFPLSPWLGCNGANPLPVATGLLYVLDNVNKVVYVVNNINSQNGAVDPSATISGDLTLIQRPTAIADDGLADILYVADTTQQEILAFQPASQTNGNIAPLRTYPGIGIIVAMFYDQIDDVLYAADAEAQSILAWDNIRQLVTGTAPNRVIPLGYTPSSVFVDTQRDLLYVGDPKDQVINQYANASTLGVATTPTNSFFSNNSPFATPDPSATPEPFVFINSITGNAPNNTLFVAERSNPSLPVFTQASTLDGPAVPIHVLEGSNTTFTIHMGQIFFNDNVLYAIPSDISMPIAIFEDANNIDGDVAPTRTITINGSSEIIGVTVDLQH